MIKNNRTYLYTLVRQGEHQQLDFKQEIDDARKIARAMAAFANTQGGKLLIGVKDNGTISGIRTEEEIYMLQAAAEYYTKPKLVYSVKIWQHGEKHILEANIPESSQKPHYVQNEKGNWVVYVRCNDQNIAAEPIVENILKYHGKRYSKRIVLKADEQNLLNLFNTNYELSFEDLLKKSMLPEKILTEMVVKLVVINVLQYKVLPQKTMFFLPK